MNVALIDNYDSFTYNLSHLVEELGYGITVLRNDKFVFDQLRHFDRIILSPGPGIPSEAGLLLDIIRTYAGIKPILGICLGHQALGEVFGAKLINLNHVYHGISTKGMLLGNDFIFDRLPERIEMGRYHSWVVDRTCLPKCLEETAVSDDGQLMGLRHRRYDIHGIQFHPESILTPYGYIIMQNWLRH